MTFKKVSALFKEKYPNGDIYKDTIKNTFNVTYNKINKVYTYKATTLTELMIKLKLIKETPIIEKPVDINEFNKNEFGIILK